MSDFIDRFMGWLARTLRWEVPPQAPNLPATPSLPPKPTPTPPSSPAPNLALDTMFQAIKEFEGWYKNSASWTNNNPGNIRCNSVMHHLATGCSPAGFCVFPDYATGERAQKEGLLNTAKAKPPAPYNGEMTLQQFFERRDPPSDKNDPTKYAAFVAKRMGVDKDLWKMKNLLG